MKLLLHLLHLWTTLPSLSTAGMPCTLSRCHWRPSLVSSAYGHWLHLKGKLDQCLLRLCRCSSSMLWAYTSHLFTLQWNLGCLCTSAPWLSLSSSVRKRLSQSVHLWIRCTLFLCILRCGAVLNLLLQILHSNGRSSRSVSEVAAPSETTDWGRSVTCSEPVGSEMGSCSGSFSGSGTGVGSLWVTFSGDFLAGSCFSL